MDLISCPCTYEKLVSPDFQSWCDQIHEARGHLHRKIWEWCFISQALFERGLLKNNMRGLGFGVGQEPLVALFAKYDCKITATDSDYATASQPSSNWIDTNQYATKLEDLNKRNICENELFLKNVNFDQVNMNRIPKDLKEFDFCWSSCACEHLGSIKLGKEFIYNAMNCLKPGGIAIHTTEFNLSSNCETIDNNCAVLFLRKDFEDIAKHLKSEGHQIKLDFALGNTEHDNHIDVYPYKHDIHLRFQYGNYVSTSFGLIVKKKKDKKRFFVFNNFLFGR